MDACQRQKYGQKARKGISKKWLFRAFSLLLLVILGICLELYHSSHGLMATHYQVSTPKLHSPLRIAQITDLHDSVFGQGNERLIRMVEEEAPDMIFLTGDMINNHGEIDTSMATDLITSLSRIAPVYASLGNQEEDVYDDQGRSMAELYQEAGAMVLDSDYADISYKGEMLRVGGIYGYCQQFMYAMGQWSEGDARFLMDFQDTAACKLLLCHIPVCWMGQGSMSDWDVDFIFSGHVHGGQVRLPLVGGLYGPDQGWFPGQDCGIYTSDPEAWKACRDQLLAFMEKKGYDPSYYIEHDAFTPSTLILSRGLGNTDWVPRFNNVPELVVVDILPEDKA